MSASTDNSTGHFIINHDLFSVKLLPNSSTEFIQFLNDLFKELNYDFHIESFSYNVLFSENEFDGFTSLIKVRFGNDFEFLNKNDKLYREHILKSYLPTNIELLQKLAGNYKGMYNTLDDLELSISTTNLYSVKLVNDKKDKMNRKQHKSYEDLYNLPSELIPSKLTSSQLPSDLTSYNLPSSQLPSDVAIFNLPNSKSTRMKSSMNQDKDENQLEKSISNMLKAEDTCKNEIQKLEKRMKEIKFTEVQPYTNDSHYYFLDEYWKKEASSKEKSIYTQMCVLYYDDQMITIVLEENQLNYIKELTTYFKGFKVLKEYKNLFKNTAKDLKAYFHFREFLDMDSAKNKLSSYETLNDISDSDSTLTQNSINDMIIGYITSNYKITDDPKQIIKASVLLEQTEQAFSIDRTSYTDSKFQELVSDKLKFRKQLSETLLHLGLKKKRLSDGIYYYGIEYKDKRFYSTYEPKKEVNTSTTNEIINPSESKKTKTTDLRTGDEKLQHFYESISRPIMYPST